MRFEASKHVFAYWRRLRAGRAAPERSAIDPVALGRYLPHVFLLERGSGADFSFRLAGTGLCALFGQEMKGRSFLSSLTLASNEDGREILSTAMDDLFPVVAGASALLPDRESLETELLILPMLSDGQSGRLLFGSIAYPGRDRFALGRCGGLELVSFRVIGEQDTRHLQPPALPLGEANHQGERRRHLLVIQGGIGRS